MVRIVADGDIIPKGSSWSDGEIVALEKLHEEGKTITEIADATGRPWRSVQSKLKQRGLEPNAEKEVKEAAIAGKAKTQVLGRISQEITEEASGIYEQMVGAGQWLYEKYNTIARARGITLEEYVGMAMVFYTNYQDMIEKLEQKIKEQERTIKELTSFLTPVPYRIKIIEQMVAQEANGQHFSDQDIMRYLNAVDIALGMDITEEEGLGGPGQ